VQRRISVKQSERFDYPLMMVGEVTMSRDFDKSTRDNPVQAVDKDTGLSIWEAEVIDTDPDARKSDRSFTVKILAERQPVPPPAADGSTMRPVVFTHLEAMPYIDDKGCKGDQQPHRCRAKIAWSYRASGFAETGAKTDTTATSEQSANGSTATTESTRSSVSSSKSSSSRSAA
jgi:hypothetical protein